MRRSIVTGNWKMNGTVGESTSLAAELRTCLSTAIDAEVVVCPPATSLAAVRDVLSGGSILLGAQNVHWEPSGAFTGELSAKMLADLSCSYVIVGHSERRAQFGETDADVQRKARAAMAAGIHPIVCIGETSEERECGRTEKVLTRQVEESLRGMESALGTVVVAYEPVWAIGTGRVASAEQAQAAHAHIRGTIAALAGATAAGEIRIQYGGSLKPSNAREILAQPDVDGGLVGGASLDSDSFSAIVRAIETGS
jgi:triosephosphate isomerase